MRASLRADDLSYLDADYARLLADGIVVWPEDAHDSDHSDAWRALYTRWADGLGELATADGLRSELRHFVLQDIFYRPLVELLGRRGKLLGRRRVRRFEPPVFDWPPSQERAAARMRPLAEKAWGPRLETARRRHAQSAG